jgi:1-pyrroline-5-carboxylate dehydrogenase
MFEPYRPEPYSDFTDPAKKAAYELALAGVSERFGATYPLTIDGEAVETGSTIDSLNPSNPDEIVGVSASAGVAEAEAALAAAWGAYPSWSRHRAEFRARIGMRLAAIMRANKYELSALQTFEAGKNWGEAEADVAEAIDFVDYYARQAIRLAEPVDTTFWEGEENRSHLIPMGAGVAIPPWNFPLAILVGMAIGPVMAGNTIVVKPASNTPVIGARWMEMVAEAGMPPGVINYIPGPGGEIGDYLVDHPKTRFVNFTGSKEVGLRIAERSAVVHEGQKWLKRAYMEMGGKDALIVDETADLDAAIADAVRSAFGFQGQKCSAMSRLILVDQVYDRVLDGVVEGAGSLVVGRAAENHPVGPVISAAQHRSIMDEIAKGREEAELLVGGEAIDGGYFIQPTVFGGVDRDARLAQHEIFGPVVSVIKAADFDDALEIANGTEFGLTGGLYSRDRSRIERARRDFHVGNLYVNRKITGALVGVQPFGGFNMSGSNAKAGGPDYLRLFMEMKTVAERWPT